MNSAYNEEWKPSLISTLPLNTRNGMIQQYRLQRKYVLVSTESTSPACQSTMTGLNIHQQFRTCSVDPLVSFGKNVCSVSHKVKFM